MWFRRSRKPTAFQWDLLVLLYKGKTGGEKGPHLFEMYEDHLRAERGGRPGRTPSVARFYANLRRMESREWISSFPAAPEYKGQPPGAVLIYALRAAGLKVIAGLDLVETLLDVQEGRDKWWNAQGNPTQADPQ